MITHRVSLLLALVLLALPASLMAQDKKAAITDPSKAGPDFAIQGEYIGQIAGKMVGAQVVALGDDKFDVVVYTGGLPGRGWKKGDKKEKATGKFNEDGTVTIAGEKPATIKDGKLHLEGGAINKVDRKSPTLGVKAPQGAKVLFDGTNNEFTPGKLTPDGLLAHGQNSKHKFTKSFTLHLEFRLPYQPYARGQGRANSGVFLSGGSEVQVLDSFGLEGRNNECGGFYSKREPDVNMCFPPLSWQTYDVDVTVGADKTTATVRHNGVVIHADYVIDFRNGGTLQLQDHGNPVAYRNIWIVERE